LKKLKLNISSFKAYDVRGRIPDELNADIAYRIANGMADFLKAKRVILGRDIRSTSEELANAVAQGLMDAGVDVIDIGLCGTEGVYFATGSLGACGGIMVTASHNPADYNGMKLVRENAKPIGAETGLKEIRLLAESENRFLSDKKGNRTLKDISLPYIKRILDFIDIDLLKPMRIVVNPGNGGAGLVVDQLSEYLPFDFVKVHFVPDASFPNGVPNPMIEENRESTSAAVREHNADLGIAWDGDFDRCFFFDEKGDFIEGYYIVGLLAENFLKKTQSEKIIYDPRLTWNTIETVTNAGGKAIQSQSGHSFIKQCMRENDAIYGGEMSAHHYFRDFYYCDSGMIPWLLIAELISSKGQSLSSMLDVCKANYPASGEINRKVKDTSNTILKIRSQYKDHALSIDMMDGVSMEFSDWRFNVRASNTEPLLRLNVESRADYSLMQVKTNELLEIINRDS
jgi:phosphomannomutase